MNAHNSRAAAAVFGLLLWAPFFLTTSEAQRQKTEYVIQGRVYNGDVGDQSSPIEGVTVTVYGSNNPHPELGTEIRSTSTNSDGWYGLSVFDDDGFWNFYHVVETDPEGFESQGATSVDGAVRTANWIEFEFPIDNLDLTGNKFWDRPEQTPTPTPTPTATGTPTPTPTQPVGDTPTNTTTPTPTATTSFSPTPTPSATQTPTTPSGNSVVICAVADTFVNDGNPTGNYGAEPFLEVGYGSGPGEAFSRRALVGFDLEFISPGTQIVGALLEVSQIHASGLSAVQVSAHEALDPWDPTTVTWDDQPVASAPSSAQTTVDTSMSVFGWNVRTLVQKWVDDPAANHGAVLKGPESGTQWTRQFASLESTTFCPRLVIELPSGVTLPTPTPTPTPSPTATSAPVCPHADAAGDSFAAATSLTASNQVYEYICPSGDVDWWKIQLEHGQEIQVYLMNTALAPPADYDVFLYDPNGAERAASAIFGAHKGGYLSHVSTIAGEWRILVRGKGVADWSKNKAYGLRADTSFPCASPDEAGDYFSNATPLTPSIPQAGLSRPVYGYLCPAGDRDFYRFSVPGGSDTIKVDLTELPTDFDVALYKPDGSWTANSTASSTTSESITFTASGVGGEWRVEVYGKGGTAYHGHPYKLEVGVSSDADLTVRGIEITQGIQDLNHTVPLIKGKPVWARVYLDIGKATGPLDGVDLELAGWAFDDFGAVSTLPGSPIKLGPLTVKDPPAQLDPAQRLLLTAESSIVLPAGWLENGPKIRLRAEVNKGKNVPEKDFTNNVKLVEHGDVVWKKPIHLYFVPIKAGGKVPTVNSAVLKELLTGFKAVMPIPNVVIHFAKKPLSADHDYTLSGSGSCGEGWSDLLDDLSGLGGWLRWTGPPHSIVFGVLHTDVPSVAGGCGRVGSNVAAGKLWKDSWATVAHEVGHNFGRMHTPCTGLTGDTVDNSYPNYTDPLGGLYPRGSTGEVGVHVFDTTRPPQDPKTSIDFMSYCPNKWVSPYTYQQILSKMSSAKAASRRHSEGPRMAVSGRVVGDTVDLKPIWILVTANGGTMAKADGPYGLQLRDASGTELHVRTFDPFFLCGVDEHTCGYFDEVVPFVDGTTELRVLRGDEVLKTVSASPNPPVVEVVSPNGGETWDGDGPFEVMWTATDPDGDPLTATVMFSADGEVWQPVEVEIEGDSAEVDGSALAGGDGSQVRVVVTDGFNTTGDSSDGVFSVSPKPPSVLLLRPSPGELVETARQLQLHALVNDPEDGPLTGDRLVWRSDRDGDIGTGDSLTVGGLSCGSHEIALEAVDSHGMSGFDSVVVTSLGGCEGNLLVIPAAANSTGALGTHWSTDAVIHNPGSEPVTVYLYLLVKQGDPRFGPGLAVPAGQSIRLVDVVGDYFGEIETSGAILAASTEPVLITTRTFNDASAGTLGQYTPGHIQIDAVGGGRRATLIQLSRTDRYRTNIGFANPRGEPLVVHVEIFDSSGSSLGRRTKTVTPWGYLQINDVIRKVTQVRVEDAFAVVWSDDTEAEYFTYASVVDNGSGDPIYVAPVDATAAELYLPSAAHNPGLNSTLWRTDLEVCNPAATEAEFRIDLFEAGVNNRTPQSVAFRLQAGACRRYPDAVGLFDYEGSGALRIVPSTGNVSATARTFNDLGDRSFGQYIPPWYDADSAEAGERVRLLHLSQYPGRDAGSRTNIGVVSVVDNPIDVTIDLFYGTGGYIGRKTVRLKPFGFLQLTEPIKKLTDAEVIDAYAVIRSDTQGARYLAYASVIDNLSGDPVYIPAARR